MLHTEDTAIVFQAKAVEENQEIIYIAVMPYYVCKGAIPNTSSPWLNGKMNLLIKGSPALLDSSVYEPPSFSPSYTYNYNDSADNIGYYKFLEREGKKRFLP